MEEKNEELESGFLILWKKKKVQIALIILLILLALAKVVNDKFFRINKYNKEVITSENENYAVRGKINTDVENGKKEDENISRYSIDDGFSEVEDVVKPINTSSNNTPAFNIDKSSLTGSDITISEGSSFEAIRDLKLSATDKDGSNISSKINIESNNVNTERPGVYSVVATVTLNNGVKLQKLLNVNVTATNLEVAVDSFKATKDRFNKNEQVTLDLNIKSSKKYVKANAVMINGKEYPLYKGRTSLFSNNQKYKINVDPEVVSGKKDYKLSYIRMSDNTLINVDNSAITEVLKAEAKIKNFTYEGQALSKRILAKFDLEDIDNSASNFKMEVYRDGELIHTSNLDKKDKYEEYIRTHANGVYSIKILADVNVYSEFTEKNTSLSKEVFSETIKISNIDESSLTGKSIEIMEGEKFDPIVNLELKAVDIHGEDITKKIVIDSNNVDVNKPGKYTVKAHVINKKNRKLNGTFNVTVKEKVKEDNVDTNSDAELEVATFAAVNSNDSRSKRALTRDVITGDDTKTLDANVKVTGIVTKDDGTAPNGKLQVEVPTSLAFSIDQNGNFNSPAFTIKNDSSVDVTVSVASFRETQANGGITVKPASADLTNLDRSNVHLSLSGDKTVDLGEKITSDQHLADIESANTKRIQLLGKAGKAKAATVDANGTSEEFNLVFKIKKKK